MICTQKLSKESLDSDPPYPDLIIYLQASTDILLGKNKNRGLDMESNINKKYVNSVNDVYMSHFHEYTASPTII